MGEKKLSENKDTIILFSDSNKLNSENYFMIAVF